MKGKIKISNTVSEQHQNLAEEVNRYLSKAAAAPVGYETTGEPCLEVTFQEFKPKLTLSVKQYLAQLDNGKPKAVVTMEILKCIEIAAKAMPKAKTDVAILAARTSDSFYGLPKCSQFHP